MRNSNIQRQSALVFILGMIFTSTGCFLQTLSGATFQTGNQLITTVQTDSILATCVQGGSGSVNVECIYFFFDENGVLIEATSSADLISELGILGVVIDPLIYQIPANASNIIGTYDDNNGSSGDLDLLSGYRSIPIDANRILFADPGTIFVIAELPENVVYENVQFQFSLSFSQPGSSALPVVVKPMLALKYEGNNQVFYPPMLPCAHNMASVPAYTIAQAADLQPIALNPTTSGCINENYLLVGFGGDSCDFDGDFDVDADDIALQASVRNSPALQGDRLDTNGDGIIDLNDARQCALECHQPRCGIPTRKQLDPLESEIVIMWQERIRP